jgi:hypothetical protein
VTKHKKKRVRPLIVVVPIGLPMDYGPYMYGPPALMEPPPPIGYSPVPAPYGPPTCPADRERYSGEETSPAVTPRLMEVLPPPTPCLPPPPQTTPRTPKSAEATHVTSGSAIPVTCPASPACTAVRGQEHGVPTAERKTKTAYVVELSMMEAKLGQKPQGVPFSEIRYSSHLVTTSTLSSRISMAVVPGVTAVAKLGDTVKLHSGSVRDLLAPVRHFQEPQDPDCARGQDDVHLGQLVQVNVVRADKGLVRVDLTVHRNEVDKASQDGIVVLGKCLRTVQKVKLGQVKKVALNRDDKSSWIEFKVTQLPKAGPVPCAFPCPVLCPSK